MITNVPESSLAGLRKLLTLYLSDNRITSEGIANTFGDLEQLQIL